MNKQHENNEKNSTLKSIWEIIVGLSSIAALILSRSYVFSLATAIP